MPSCLHRTAPPIVQHPSRSVTVNKLTATLTVVNGNNAQPGAAVRLNLVATSTAGVVTTVLWSCDNGDAPVGGHPTVGNLANPDTVALSGTLPSQLICYYSRAGSFTPYVRVHDSRGNYYTTTVPVTVIP